MNVITMLKTNNVTENIIRTVCEALAIPGRKVCVCGHLEAYHAGQDSSINDPRCWADGPKCNGRHCIFTPGKIEYPCFSLSDGFFILTDALSKKGWQWNITQFPRALVYRVSVSLKGKWCTWDGPNAGETLLTAVYKVLKNNENK